MTDTSEQEKLQQFVARWKSVERTLLAFVRYQGASPAEAEDVAQETAIKLWRSLSTMSSWDNFGAMARAIARNVLVDRYRKDYREISTDPETLRDLGPSYTPDLALRLDFTRAWEQLSDSERAVLEAKFSGLDDGAIALRLQLAEASIRSIARRARLKLRDQMFDDN